MNEFTRTQADVYVAHTDVLLLAGRYKVHFIRSRSRRLEQCANVYGNHICDCGRDWENACASSRPTTLFASRECSYGLVGAADLAVYSFLLYSNYSFVI
jgi:hypothetical protein